MGNETTEFKKGLYDALLNMKVVRVEVKLSLKHVQPWSVITTDTLQSCLWPRVTLEVCGRQKTFPITELLGARQMKAIPGELNLWEDIAIRFCGGSKKSSMTGGVRHAVMQAGHNLRNRVMYSISRAAQTKNVQDRIKKKWKSERRKKAKQALHAYLIGSFKDSLDYLSPHDAAEVYREAISISVVQHVLET